VVHIYFISTNNGAGQPIPTLKMMELSGGAMVETPLVEGIEEFNVEYGIDTNGDGTTDAYTTDPTVYVCAGCTPESNWRNVVTVQLYVLARNTELSPNYKDDKTYTLGRDVAGNPLTKGPFNNGYRRHMYTGLVRIANVVGRRDTP
jgi:type IV pilus assembly protein PilW